MKNKILKEKISITERRIQNTKEFTEELEKELAELKQIENLAALFV